MAIAFNNININGTTISVPTDNPIVFCGLQGNIGSDSISAVTLGGVSMVLVDKQLTGGTNGRYSYLFVLQAPPTGNQTLVVTGGTAALATVTYTGAAQSGQVDATSKVTGGDGSTSKAISVTTVVDNCWVTGYINASSGNKWVASTGATARDTTDTQTFMDSNGPKTPAGSYTMNATNNSSGCSWIAASFKPFIANLVNIKSINGLAKASIKSINGLALANVKNINGLA